MLIYGIVASDEVPAPTIPPGAPARFIAVGTTDGQDSPILMTTENDDALAWVDRSSAAIAAAPNAVLQDVCYSASLDRWVAVGYDSSSFGDPRVIYSNDGGNTWTAATADPATAFMILGICWTGAAFIAVGKTGSSTPKVMSSSNGISWTARTSAPTSAVSWVGVHGISGLAVAAGGVNSPIIMTSANDGTSWTQRTPGGAGSIGQLQDVVCVSSGTHVAVGFSSTSARGGVETSTNGTTWTGLGSGLPSDQQYYGVAYNGSIYVAVGADFNTSFEGRAASSTSPASTWTARTTDPVTAASSNGPNWLSVAAGVSGGFVACGRDNNGFNIPYLMYSATGTSWTARTPAPATNCILQGVGARP